MHIALNVLNGLLSGGRVSDDLPGHQPHPGHLVAVDGAPGQTLHLLLRQWDQPDPSHGRVSTGVQGAYLGLHDVHQDQVAGGQASHPGQSRGDAPGLLHVQAQAVLSGHAAIGQEDHHLQANHALHG